VIAISAVDRVGNLSVPAVLSPRKPSPVFHDRHRPDWDWPPKQQ
jgi:hypothetical protein